MNCNYGGTVYQENYVVYISGPKNSKDSCSDKHDAVGLIQCYIPWYWNVLLYEILGFTLLLQSCFFCIQRWLVNPSTVLFQLHSNLMVSSNVYLTPSKKLSGNRMLLQCLFQSCDKTKTLIEILKHCGYNYSQMWHS